MGSGAPRRLSHVLTLRATGAWCPTQSPDKGAARRVRPIGSLRGTCGRNHRGTSRSVILTDNCMPHHNCDTWNHLLSPSKPRFCPRPVQSQHKYRLDCRPIASLAFSHDCRPQYDVKHGSADGDTSRGRHRQLQRCTTGSVYAEAPPPKRRLRSSCSRLGQAFGG